MRYLEQTGCARFYLHVEALPDVLPTPFSGIMPALLSIAILMIEINPITNQIKDLRERTDALRGYL